MFRILKSGFTRYFLGGFVMGAIGLVAVQSATPPVPPLFPPAAAESTH